MGQGRGKAELGVVVSFTDCHSFTEECVMVVPGMSWTVVFSTCHYPKVVGTPRP